MQGGFARCYQVTAETDGQLFAVKVVPKDSLMKPKQKHKVGGSNVNGVLMLCSCCKPARWVL